MKIHKISLLVFILLTCFTLQLASSNAEKIVTNYRSSILQIGTFVEKEKEISYQTCGTAFVVGEKGLIATANHVIDACIILNDGKYHIFINPGENTENSVKWKADIVLRDTLNDLALLKCKAVEKFPVLQFGKYDKVNLTDEVLILGYPIPDKIFTVTKGFISAEDTINFNANSINHYTNVFKIDGSINKGNSGSPVFHVKTKKVIGIVNSKSYLPLNELLWWKNKQEKSFTGISTKHGNPEEILIRAILLIDENYQLGYGYGIYSNYLEKLIKEIDN